ncbi:MAG: hypothetical protein AB8B95_12960, partial [Pseudohongiellaceae bacterium]
HRYGTQQNPMKHSDLILLARAVANESEEKGFIHTAAAMRLVTNQLLMSENNNLTIVMEETIDSIRTRS